jgi:hypothetical protein
MTDDELEPDLVCEPCPSCCESRADYLEWRDDEIVLCLSCGNKYRPGEPDTLNE